MFGSGDKTISTMECRETVLVQRVGGGLGGGASAETSSAKSHGM